MRRSHTFYFTGLALILSLSVLGCSGLGAASPSPTTRSAVSAIPSLEVSYPASFNLAGTTKGLSASRSISGTTFDPSALDEIRSEAWLAFKREIANPDGPNVNAYIKSFQNYVKNLASIATGAPITMPSSLGKASFDSTQLAGGGLETTIHWSLPRTISASTVAKMSDVDWTGLPLNADGSASLTFDIYMDIKQDSASNLTGFVFQLVSAQTYLPSGGGAPIPFVKISATNDGNGGYELYSLYYGNIRYEKSVSSGGAVSFVKEIDRPYPQGLNSATGTYDYPNGRQFYFYGYGDANQGGVTYLDYDPKFAANPAAADDIYLHREVFDSAGHLLFKQYGLTTPANSKLLASYGSTTGINLASSIGAATVSAGSGSGSVQTGPWKLTITYDIDGNGQVSSIDSITTASGQSLTPPSLAAALPPKFYFEKTDGAASWSPGDAVYYPESITGVSGSRVTQVFVRGYTVPNTASVAGLPFYVSNKYPLKYMGLSSNLDSSGTAYDASTPAYAFYDWLGTPVTNLVWYDLAGLRHDDGTYVPRFYWISKQSPGGSYDQTKGDLQIGGVEMAKAYTLGATDPTTGLPTVGLDFVPMLSTTSLSAPGSGDLASGAVASGYYGELPLFLDWKSEAAVSAVLSRLEGQETDNVFTPGTLNLTSFLASATMGGFQASSSFPAL